MSKYEFHPVSEIFPLMSGEALEALVDDIRANGLREEIWTWKGKIIDGRNRYSACERAGVQPRFREWDGAGELTAFVISLNLHRRHLDESQRAMVASKIATAKTGNPEFQANNAISPIGEIVTRTRAAELLNVSSNSITRAKKVREQGVPELVEMVEKGDISVTAAREIARLPAEEQRKELSAGPKAIAHKSGEYHRQRRADRNNHRTKTRKMPSRRKAPEAIRSAIGTLVGLATGLDDFTVADVVPTEEETGEWERELLLCINAINRFRKQLKEHSHV